MGRPVLPGNRFKAPLRLAGSRRLEENESMTTEPAEVVRHEPSWQQLQELRQNIEQVFYGKREAVDQIIIALLARGHVLIEDVPGVGKTVLARAMAKSVDCSFNRMQMTPDLLPADILGVSIYNKTTGQFEFKPGPIFANIILADEINRTTPRTQSALLEAMNESQVTVDGRPVPLPQPFMVMATQNPFEFEGTYFLPENQLDRFVLRIRIGYPSRQYERQIARKQPDRKPLADLQPVTGADQICQLQEQEQAVRLSDLLLNYILDLVDATRSHPQVAVGVSPRGTLALVHAAQAAALLAGRDYVIPDDIKALATAVFAHRMVTKSYLREGQVSSGEQIIREILASVTVPE
jgi:MoxR-like ATPase